VVGIVAQEATCTLIACEYRPIRGRVGIALVAVCFQRSPACTIGAIEATVETRFIWDRKRRGAVS
jgi:hypothetical protein